MSNLEAFIGDLPNKHFTNAIIKWEIKHFTLLTCSQQPVVSPVIKLLGPIDTSWQIHLDISKNRVVVKLEMLPDNSIKEEFIKVHWAFCLLDETEKGTYSTERTYTFSPKHKLHTEFLLLKEIHEILSKKSLDNLFIKCRMLLTFGLKVQFPKAAVAGVMELSNDLRDLPKSFLYHDIVTTVGKADFSLHKAMLYQRGETIARLIEQSTSDMKVNFSLSDAVAADSVFRYLYSGDLAFILRNPQITISEYIEQLAIPELKGAYSPQEISIASKVDVMEEKCCWTVLDFKKATKTLLGPEFQMSDKKTQFQLSLNVKISKDDKPIKSLFVEAALLNCDRLLTVCIEFACGKNENETFISRRISGIMSVGERFGVTLLSNDSPEMEDYFINDMLIIKVVVYIRKGDLSSDVVENIPPNPSAITSKKCYATLIRILSQLLKSKTYSDFTFKVEGQEIAAHKFLAAARSSLMKELFRREGGVASVKIRECNKDVFEKLLSYMYVGIISETDGNKLIKLYHLAVQYNVNGLPEMVPKLISKVINKNNMLNVLMFADDIGHEELKKTATEYVLSQTDNWKDHRDFFKFLATKPKLYAEIMKKASVTAPSS